MELNDFTWLRIVSALLTMTVEKGEQETGVHRAPYTYSTTTFYLRSTEDERPLVVKTRSEQWEEPGSLHTIEIIGRDGTVLIDKTQYSYTTSTNSRKAIDSLWDFLHGRDLSKETSLLAAAAVICQS